MVQVAYTVGRFQPPTIGHKKLIQAVIDAAGPGGKAYVFVSSTMTPKPKNPLTSAQKLPILQHMFPSGNVEFVDTQKCKDMGKNCGGALAAFYYLINEEKHPKEKITLVVGDDRRPEFGPGADIWKRKEEKDIYQPGNFVFLKSASRSPDLNVKDAENMSGTKAREYVKLGRKNDFYIAVGYETAANKAAADAVYDVIRSSSSSKGGSNNTELDEESMESADYEGGRRRRKRSSTATRRRRKNNLKIVRLSKVTVVNRLRRY
jgi:nicotinic acid mononucleotide adenylyltransferase